MKNLSHSILRSVSALAAITLAASSCLSATAAPVRARARSHAPAAAQRAADGKSDRSSGDAREAPDETSADAFEIPFAPFDTGKPNRRPGRIASTATPAYISTTLAGETEPNNTSATATPIVGTTARIRANVYPNADVDFYSFSGTAGNRVYAATMTSFSASASVDSVLDLINTDGTTVIETDNDDGSFGSTSSSIAGATLPTTGTFFLRVRNNSATAQLRPYDLYFQLRSGAPVAEVESNDTTATAQPIPASGWVSGSTSSTTDVDFYSVTLNAGDTIYMSLDLDPERDTVEWNAQLGLAAFGTPPLILVVNDPGTATPDSEAYFMSVKATGTYFIFVGLPTGGTTFGTYHLSATVLPQTSPGSCTTYTSTNVPVTIPTGPAIVTSTLTVPGNPRIAKLRVNLNLTHNFMADLDVQLTSPSGSTIGLFSDVGSVTAGAQTTMDTVLDDDAGIPIGQFTVVQGPAFTPELNYRLGWFTGVDAGGTWTLTIRDDATGDGGTLNSWGLVICEDPQPFCTSGTPTTILNTNFEADDGGFTHSGTADEWERGTPSFAPITTANSGTTCWKTDLDNTYNASSNQELLSPNLVLPAAAAIHLTWAQKYQIESANFDHAFVEVREVGGSGMVRRLWEHLEATMTDAVGNPTVTVQEASGWSTCERDISDFAGKTVQIVFHVDSDTTVQLCGFAVDDVSVVACLAGADMAITSITDSPDPRSVGGPITYTIGAANNGASTADNVTVTLPLPAGTTFNSVTTPPGWTATTPPVGSNGSVVFSKASVASAETASFTVVADVACSVANGTVLTATATAATTSSDSNSGNDSASATTTVTNAAPVVTCPANITMSATTGQCGAVATFAPTVTDDNTCTASVVCAPASGTSFPVGTTTVTCTATDAAGNTGTCSFTVTVNDTQAPTITCPANVVTTAMTATGSVVNYAAPTVSDNCPGVGVPACTPASGSFFPLGVTTVTCTVADGAANTASCSFTVTVGTGFTNCFVDDASGDTISIVADRASPLYGFWQYHVAATNQVFQGTAESLVYYPNRSLTAYDHDSVGVRMDLTVSYSSRTATATVRVGTATFVLRDRNITNDPPCT